MNAVDLLARIDRVRKSSTGPGRWMARCPAHADRSASLSVRELDDGRVLLHCFAGCTAPEVSAAVGVEMRELFPPSREAADLARRSPPLFMDMVKALELDVLMVAVCAAQLARGDVLSGPARTRLRESSARIMRGIEECRHG